MQTLGSTSVPPLLKYLRHAEHLGVATAPALAAAGITAGQLDDNSLRLPVEAHERLLEYFCEHSGDLLFGLNSARFVLPNSWSVLGYITMNCATLGEVMNLIILFELLVGDMGTSRAEMVGEQVRLIWNCRHQQPRIRRHMVENVLASWLVYARWIAYTELSPSHLFFEHPLPDGAQFTTHTFTSDAGSSGYKLYTPGTGKAAARPLIVVSEEEEISGIALESAAMQASRVGSVSCSSLKRWHRMMA